MPDFLQSTTRWMRALFRRGEAATGRPGEEARASGHETLLSLEGRIAEVIWHPRPTSAPLADNDFGRRVVARHAVNVRQAVSAAEGIALTGARTAAFLPAGSLEALHDSFASATSNHVPLVLHHVFPDRARGGTAPEVGHRGYHRLADCGAPLVLPRDAQNAVDLSLVARRVAEQALVPALVAVDGPTLAWALCSVRVPDAEQLRGFLGAPDEWIGCPTPAQALLFGPERRRVLAWFDPDRPVAHGVPLRGADLDGSLVSRQRYFVDHLPALVRRACADLAALTGRPLPLATTHGLGQARVVVVAQGSTVGVAEAVADHLRTGERKRVGVVGVQWLRPFPDREVREALAGADTVVVCERIESPGPDAPLLREVRASLGEDRTPHFVSATWGPSDDVPPAGDLAELCRRALGGRAPPTVRLGLHPLTAASRHPKRQAWLDRVEREYPSADEGRVEGAPLLLGPASARRVAIHAVRGDVPPGALSPFTDALSDAAGPRFATRVHTPEPDLWVARVTAADEAVPTVGREEPVDVAVIASVTLPDPLDPFAEVREGGAAVVRSQGDLEHTWASLAPRWRATIVARKLRLHAVEGDWAAMARVAAALAAGRDAVPGALDGSPWPVADLRREVPLAVRRFGEAGRGHDSVPRFWGEVAAPRLDGELSGAVADPHLALGAVPAATATFHDASRGRDRVPTIDMDRCTGCAGCWSGCPDTAIAPVALRTQALLDAAEATARGGSRSGAAAKLARAHKQLATRVDSLAAGSDASTLTPALLDEAFAWLLDKMNPSDEDRAEMQRAFEATRAEAVRLPAARTDPLFREPHRASKGSGAWLLLAVDPRACQGCGVCAEECPEEAIRMEAATDARRERMHAEFATWERLPDTDGATLASAAERPEVGPLGAALLSRHCLLSTIAGEGAEPGSGARVAVRLATAVTEYQMQRHTQSEVEEVARAIDALRRAIRDDLAGSVDLQDLGSIERAVGEVPAHAGNLGALVDHLEEHGVRPGIDARAVFRKVHAARELERLRHAWVEGAHGTGRARYALALAGDGVASWAARYPRNPFVVPVSVDATGGGADRAAGLAEGLLARRADDVRRLRLGRLLVDSPSDLPAKLRELDALGWQDLTAEERQPAAPVLLVTGPEILGDEGLAGLGRLLASDRPVRVLLLDDRELPRGGPEPVLFGLSHRDAYVAASSIAEPDHLFRSLSGALAHPGPAFVHVHAPSPRRHGFAAAHTLERARLAVTARVQPLLRYDPRGEGVFGSRLDLSGNPEPEAAWATDAQGAPVTPAHWARGEARYASELGAVDPEAKTTPVHAWAALPAAERVATTPTVPGEEGDLAVGGALGRAVVERLETWRTLQEIAGLVTPFTANVREEAEQALREAHRAELEHMRAEHQAQVAALQQQRLDDQADRLRSRLMELAGYGPPSTHRPKGGNGA